MSDTETRPSCGHTVIDGEGIEQPCGRPVTGWRWYQDVEHEDCLLPACSIHENVGGNRMHEDEAQLAHTGAHLAAARAEVARLTHLLGSHADGHRCTCTMTDPGKPGIEPDTWEQDPWCPTHPDMDVVLADATRLREAVERIERLAKSAAIEAHTRMWPVVERDWLDVLAIIERISASVVPSGETESGEVTLTEAQAAITRCSHGALIADLCTAAERRAERKYDAPARVSFGGSVGTFVELLPPDVGHNLRHFGPETTHVTGAECHCHPEPIPHAPAPVSSGGQADGEGKRPCPGCSSLTTGEVCGTCWATSREHALAARPVLSREALGEVIAAAIGHVREMDSPDCPSCGSYPHTHPKTPGCSECAEDGWPCDYVLSIADAVLAVLSEGQEAGR